MHFEFTHRFRAPVDKVQRAMLDAAFPGFLLQHHPKMMEAEVQSREDKGSLVTRKVRYRPKPIIESVGPKKIPPEYLAFIEESTFDLEKKRLDFKNVPTMPGVARHLSNGGTMTFREVGGECERVTTGELAITNLPFLLRPLGAIAERIIHMEAHKLLDQEAKVLQQFLDTQSSRA
ncbi:MAG TPA: hypothetical protein VF881_13645 [Polyangiaceae bacterium]